MVEIPRGSRNKYEYDEETHVFRLDRVLSSAVYYNFDYGFIEGTRAGDGDHTDALLIIDEPTFTGCHVWARPIGGLEMRDEKGFDFKVLCVAIGDAHQQHIERLKQVRPHRLVEIEHFFETYKALEDKTVDVRRLARRATARSRSCATDRAAWERETSARRPGERRRPPAALARSGPARAAHLLRRPAPARSHRRRSRTSSTRVRAEGVPGGGRDVRWVRLDGLHLTLRFLGPTLDDRIEAATEALRTGGQRPRPAFDIVDRRRRDLPAGGRPRALWLDVRAGRGRPGRASRARSIGR